MKESFDLPSMEKSVPEEILPDSSSTEKGATISPDTLDDGESKEKMLDADKALDEEEGALRHFANLGGGKVKKGIATLMLGSALLLGMGSFRANAEASGGQNMNTIEVQGQSGNAGHLMEGLANHAKEEKNLGDYAANKRAAIDEVRAYVLSRQGEERKKALADIAIELQNPVVQKSKGLQDGIKTMIDALRHMQ